MSGGFPDLAPRVASAVVMAALGLGAVWLGGWWFTALVLAAVAVMGWELHRMHAPDAPQGLAQGVGLLGAVWVYAFGGFSPQLLAFLLMMVPAVVIALRLPRERQVFGAYFALVLMAGHALIVLREGLGPLWFFWLVAVVVASDVAGYFAGRFIGGPKLWPRVSPKKTWSGTVAGWALAAVAGLAFMAPLGAGGSLVLLSVLVAMAGQAGDIAESAVKRRAGVKDSSNLIPGHGGLLDRFDALMAAAVLVALLYLAGQVAAT